MLTALQHITDIAVNESKKTGEDKVTATLTCVLFHVWGGMKWWSLQRKTASTRARHR
jgi:hypothetical protein